MDDDTHIIDVCNSTGRYRIGRSKVINMAQVLMNAFGLYGYCLSISFVNPSQIKKLNSKYRSKNKSTDVLSFAQIRWKKPLRPTDSAIDHELKILGDIVISPKDAQQRNPKLDEEVGFLLVHGFLHLCGYDHLKTKDKLTMEKAQKSMLNLLVVSSGNRYPMWHKCISIKTKPKKGN